MPEHPFLRPGGWVLIVLGIGIAVAGLMTFGALGTTMNPTGKASRLATTGIYGFTRNPMYLGATIAFIGLSFVLGWLWLLILALLMPLALRKLAIEPEEAYLERRFGKDFQTYRDRVRRWL